MILVFWMLIFKPAFSLSSLTLIKRLFSSPSLSTITVVSFAYLRLLIILPAILISAYNSSTPGFCMMYSPEELNRQGDNIQPWSTPFPIWNVYCSTFGSKCCFLSCNQVSQESGKGVWYSHLLKNFLVCCDPHKVFSVVNEADVLLGFPCFFYDPVDAGNLIFGCSAFSKSSLNIWKFTMVWSLT